MELKTHVEKFISSLGTEIEVRLLHKRPSSLKFAFAEALQIHKEIPDDELLRKGKNYNIFPKPISQNANVCYPPINHKLHFISQSSQVKKPMLSREEYLNTKVY